MASPQIIPSIFTAVDRFTQPLRNMNNAMNNFVGTATRAQRAFSIFSPSLSNTFQRVFDYGAVFSIAGAIHFAAKSVADFESEVANLGALTGLSGKDLDEFRSRIIAIGKDVSASAVDVAQGFTLVANQMPELLHDIEGLSSVSRSAIILSRAAKVELKDSAEALTGVLNNFALGAQASQRAIDVLAQAAKVGSSEIKDTTEALSKFGSLAHNVAGATFEESVAIVELVSKFEKGAFAGDKLRNILIRLSTAPVLEAKAQGDMARFGVNTKLVADKTQSLYVRLKELSKIGTSASALKNVFDAENVNLASALLSNLDQMPELLRQLKDESQGAAIAMAKMNQNTFYGALERFKGSFVNELVSSNGIGRVLQLFVNFLNFVSDKDRIGTFVSSLGLAIAAMVTFKTVTMVVTGAMKLFEFTMAAVRITQGFFAIRTGVINGALMQQQWYARGATLALGGYNTALFTTLGVVGLLAGAFFLFSQKTDAATSSVEEYKKGIRQLDDPINKDTIGAKKYSEAISDYKQLMELRESAAYNFERGNLLSYAADKIALFRYSRIDDFIANRAPEKPQISDFVSDTSNVQEKYMPGYVPPINDTTVNIHMNIDKDGNPTVVKNLGSIPINVTSTTNQWINK